MNAKLMIVIDNKKEHTTIQPGDVLIISNNLISLQRNGKELSFGSIGSNRSVHGMDMHDKQQLVCFIADIISSHTGLYYEMSEASSEEISATFCK